MCKKLYLYWNADADADAEISKWPIIAFLDPLNKKRQACNVN